VAAPPLVPRGVPFRWHKMHWFSSWRFLKSEKTPVIAELQLEQIVL
jgi:hypothetical protein